VLDYGEREGQSKMKVLKTIRSTLALLAQRRVQRALRYRRGQVEARLAAAERAASARPERPTTAADPSTAP
jgi:hypothetical protein